MNTAEPEVGATYIDIAHREHIVKRYRRGTHVGAQPLVTILEGGRETTITLAQWRAKKAGMVLL
jgi:hypothetical protein